MFRSTRGDGGSPPSRVWARGLRFRTERSTLESSLCARRVARLPIASQPSLGTGRWYGLTRLSVTEGERPHISRLQSGKPPLTLTNRPGRHRGRPGTYSHRPMVQATITHTATTTHEDVSPAADLLRPCGIFFRSSISLVKVYGSTEGLLAVVGGAPIGTARLIGFGCGFPQPDVSGEPCPHRPGTIRGEAARFHQEAEQVVSIVFICPSAAKLFASGGLGQPGQAGSEY